MRALREMGGGLIIAIVSVLLVIGGISLSLAENTSTEQPTPTPLPPIFATSIELPTNTPIVEITNIVTNTEIATFTSTFTPLPSVTLPSVTLTVPVVCIHPVGWVPIPFTANDTLYSIAERYKTTTDILNTSNCLNNSIPAVGSVLYVPPVPTVTVVPCKPYAGWIKAYTVRAGDNLYRISLLYRTTVAQLQFANCMGSSVTIYVGQVLWVPNVPTSTPGVTTIPVFNTATSTPVPLPTSTFVVTDSPVPSATTAPTNTSVPATPTASITPFPSPTTPTSP